MKNKQEERTYARALYYNQHYSIAEIAELLGISKSSVFNYIKGRD